MEQKDLVHGGPDIETLERLLDRYSLANVIEGLVTICHGKAEHVRYVWQETGADWDADARTLDRIVSKLRNAG